MSRLLRSLHEARGATTTETLIVLVLGMLLAGSAVAILAPGLLSMASDAVAPLGVDLSSVRPDPDASSGAGWYVLLAFLTVGFFAFFVAPFLFPSARGRRQGLLIDLSEKLPFLLVFVDEEAKSKRGLDELRQLGDEVKRMQGTPIGGVEAARPNAHHNERVVVEPRGVGSSEEPTVERGRLDERAIAAGVSKRASVEEAISDVPTIAPLGAGPSDEPTESVPQLRDREQAGERGGRGGPGVSPVLRSLSGVRPTDYRAPEAVSRDEDETIVRSVSTGAHRRVGGREDDTTNVVSAEKVDAARILAAASDVELAGPEEPTALREAPDEEDLRKTIANDVRDPAGPDSTTQVNYSKD